MKELTVSEAITIIDSADSFDDFAIRGDDYVPEVSFANSHYHGDEESEFELDGISCFKLDFSDQIINKIARAKKYGKYVFLLRGRCHNAHEVYCDPDESLINNNEILGVIVSA
jgi:hypothetical protein